MPLAPSLTPSARHILNSTSSDLVRVTLRAIEQAIGRKLDWEQDDSRCKTSRRACVRRACGCWPIVNNALLLSTSNRSEAAVGYATMDGDTSGGLSPIAGIDKAFLAPLAALAGNEGPDWISCHSRAGRQ